MPPPDWAADALWYQVFVSRFCNGDPGNDPPGTVPWDAEWLALQPGESPPLARALADRRYGGDLQGVIRKLPYLRELGINALYLNPIFEARTQHKYDTSDYRHIDQSFGLRESGARRDSRTSTRESGARRDSRTSTARDSHSSDETLDPDTWRWTASDRVFLDLLREAHAARMHVIIDGVFNHVGEDFWAWQAVLARGRASPYADWFEVTEWGSPAGSEASGDSMVPLKWNGWSGPGSSMVRVARRGDGLHPDYERHIFDITRRWMDPDGDGNPSDGVDGWRLDVADAVPHEFWKRWAALVKSINPQALIIGEVWGDASAWLGGGEFDAVMNYSFAMPVVGFFRRDARFPATELVDTLEQVLDRHSWPTSLAMQNLLDSHDTDRVVSMLANTERGYDRLNRPGAVNSDYIASEPDESAYQRLRLASFVQFTWVGAPMVYYGTEVGMYGADDPFDREPMWWGARAERHAELRRFYRELAAIRAAHSALRRGRMRILLADDARRALAYVRWTADETLLIAINAGGAATRLTLYVGSRFESAQAVFPDDGAVDGPHAGCFDVDLDACAGRIVKLSHE